jgi:hypothetical protein
MRFQHGQNNPTLRSSPYVPDSSHTRKAAPQNNAACLRTFACNDDAGNALTKASAIAAAAVRRMIISRIRLMTWRERASCFTHQFALPLSATTGFFDLPESPDKAGPKATGSQHEQECLLANGLDQAISNPNEISATASDLIRGC